MTDTVKEKLVELLAKYFDIGDSYAYNLTREKEAFAVGTVTIDDFVEFDDEVVADIAGHLIDNGVTVQEWISVEERLPEHDKLVLVCDANEGVHGYVGIWSFEIDKDDGSDCWYDSGGWWHPLEEVTHWMPLPEPPKGE
jgi:hypothetical protein